MEYGVFRKKVSPQQLRNAEQQLCVNAVVVENAVAGAAVDVQLMCQPRYRTALLS